jgi:heme-degrading monooxygenase HmoA
MRSSGRAAAFARHGVGPSGRALFPADWEARFYGPRGASRGHDWCKDAFVIARRWTALAEGSVQADAYAEHFARAVRPQLESTDGFLGATLERVEVHGAIEIVVVTRWESMAAITAFAGADVDLAVVEAEARAVLSRFDDRVRHIELADGQVFGHLS